MKLENPIEKEPKDDVLPPRFVLKVCSSILGIFCKSRSDPRVDVVLSPSICGTTSFGCGSAIGASFGGKTYSDDNEIESCLWLVRCKQILFKVEITDENLKHNWRNYAVKRTSDNVDLINQFIAHHKIEISIEENEPNQKNDVHSTGDEPPFEVRLAECGDSIKTQHKDAVDEGTPCIKVIGKRTDDSVGSATKDVLEPAKLKCVKTEKDA